MERRLFTGKESVRQRLWRALLLRSRFLDCMWVFYWEPVKLDENEGNVVSLRSPGNSGQSPVAGEECAAVIEAGSEERAEQDLGPGLGQWWAESGDGTEVE